MSVTLEGHIAILHLIAFLPSPPQDKSKVMVQRRSLSTAGFPQAEGRLFLLNSMSRLRMDANNCLNLCM